MPKISTEVCPHTNRPILYPHVFATVCTSHPELMKEDNDTSLTDEKAKKLLGWQEPEGTGQFEDPLFTDTNGIGIVCTNIDKQRPFYMRLATKWKEEILAGNWHLNGESMIIGRTGLCVDAQHRLVGFCLAVQEWLKDSDGYPNWEEEPTLEAIIVFGVIEDIRIINTINTGKPRSLTDAIFACSMFPDVPKKTLKELSRITSNAVTVLWSRIVGTEDEIDTHSSMLNFLEFLRGHQTLLECVMFVYERKEEIKPVIGLGTAAALMYLFACSDSSLVTDGDGYGECSNPTEKLLDFSNLELAKEFWEFFAERNETMDGLRECLIDLIEADYSTNAETIAAVIKAWNLYGRLGSTEGLTLSYANRGGTRILAEFPTVGGIDLGKRGK